MTLARRREMQPERVDRHPRDSKRSGTWRDRFALPNTRAAVAATIVCVILAACGTESVGDPKTANRSVQPASLAAGEPIPTPTGEVDLEMSGAIGVTNDGEDLLVDVTTLERMPIVEATVFEPFLKTEVRFHGVLLSDLFHYAQVDPSGHVEMTALDDYHVGFDLTKLDGDRVLVAVRADGDPIPIADGGPVRIIFLDAGHGLGANTDNWIWSVSHMAFEEDV